MEKNSNKGLKKLVLLLLLFVGLGASVTAGAYWASSFTVTAPAEATGTVEVEVGEGQAIAVSTSLSAATSGDTKVLVPAGFVVDENNQTATKSFTVTASWAMVATNGIELEDINQNGVISAGDVVITGVSETDAALFTVTVTPASSGTIVLGGTNLIKVTVTMNEPIDKAQYDRVANAEITITFPLNIAVGE